MSKTSTKTCACANVIQLCPPRPPRRILVPRGCDPFGQRHGSRPLQFSVRDSRTSDLSAQSRAFIKMVDQAINFRQEIQNFSDITLKEKQYEVLKLLVVEEKDVLAVLPTGYGKSLIYYLLPPV